MTPQSTETEWRAKLGAEGFRVMRENGTEAPFSGTYCDAMPSGDYYCRGCDTKLFHGRDKFVSACGWPAFTAPARLNNAKNEAASASSRLDDLLKQSEDPLKYVIDSSFGMRRVEARCRTCDSHLGHVFEEPGWTRESCGGAAASDLRNALRYCINSVCLSFRPE